MRSSVFRCTYITMASFQIYEDSGKKKAKQFKINRTKYVLNPYNRKIEKARVFREIGNTIQKRNNVLSEGTIEKTANVAPSHTTHKHDTKKPETVNKTNNSDESMTIIIPSDEKSVSGEIDNTPMPSTSAISLHFNSIRAKKSEQRATEFLEVFDYQLDILEYFRKRENILRPAVNYMYFQTDINNAMRTKLIDWLMELTEERKYNIETLYLAVAYIDRFLSQVIVPRKMLQLVGTTAMCVASKYEEIYPLSMEEYIYSTDNAYTIEQLLRMERGFIKTLSFDLSQPTANAFINTYIVLCDVSDEVKHLTMFISELALLYADPFLPYRPSIISSACLALSLYLLNYTVWSPILEFITKYRLEDFKMLLLALSEAHTKALNTQEQTVVQKYKSNEYNNVANVTAKPINGDIFDKLVADYNASAKGFFGDLKKKSAVAIAN